MITQIKVKSTGKPIIGLKFNDFEGDYLKDKVCSCEIKDGSYFFFKSVDEMNHYGKDKLIPI